MPIQVSLRALRKVIYKKCLHTDDTEISFRADQVKLEPCPNWSPSDGGLILIFRRASPSLSYRSPTGVNSAQFQLILNFSLKLDLAVKESKECSVAI